MGRMHDEVSRRAGEPGLFDRDGAVVRLRKAAEQAAGAERQVARDDAELPRAVPRPASAPLEQIADTAPYDAAAERVRREHAAGVRADERRAEAHDSPGVRQRVPLETSNDKHAAEAVADEMHASRKRGREL